MLIKRQQPVVSSDKYLLNQLGELLDGEAVHVPMGGGPDCGHADFFFPVPVCAKYHSSRNDFSKKKKQETNKINLK
jgi:hypothetical protein